MIPFGAVSSIGTFSDGRLPVTFTMGPAKRTGFVDRAGKFSVPPVYLRASAFSDGLARVQRDCDGRFGYVDTHGKVRIPFDYLAAGDFSEGLAPVLRGSRWSFIDKAGHIVLAPHYVSARRFSEGLAGVQIGDAWGFIDKQGKIDVKPSFDDVGNFSQGLAAVRDGLSWGFIDRVGRIVVHPMYFGVQAFSDDRALVSRTGFGDLKATPSRNANAGFVDSKGRFIIPYSFDQANSFVCGLAQVLLVDSHRMTRYGYIDTDGHYLWRPSN